MRKPETNQAFVKRIMAHDIMKEAFIIAAIDSYARQVSQSEPMAHGFIDGHAWKQCAQSILDDMNARTIRR